jgi:glycosyltransferase involved in cell wall biosynthesis
MYGFPMAQIGYGMESIFFRLYRRTHFITVSSSTRDDLKKMGIPAQRIAVIPEAIEMPAAGEGAAMGAGAGNNGTHKNPPTMLFLGRLAAMKQIEDFLVAASIVRKSVPELRTWIAGGGDPAYESKLKQLAEDLGLPVTFWGRVSSIKKDELLREASVLASASQKEGFGLVILEAGVWGVPSVVYNVNGFRDAVQDGETGILCKENTPENLAENVLRVLKDDALKSKLSANVLKYAWEFTFPKAAEEFEKIIMK